MPPIPSLEVPEGYIIGHSLSAGPIDAKSPAVQEFCRSHPDLDDEKDEYNKNSYRSSRLAASTSRVPSSSFSQRNGFSSYRSRPEPQRHIKNGYGLFDDVSSEDEDVYDTESSLSSKSKSLLTESVIKSEEASYLSFHTGRMDPVDMQRLSLQEASKAAVPAISAKIDKELREVNSKVAIVTTAAWLGDTEEEVKKLLQDSIKRREAAEQRRRKEEADRNKQLEQEIEEVQAMLKAEEEAKLRIQLEALQKAQREKEEKERAEEASRQAAKAAEEAAAKKKKDQEEAAVAQAKKLAAEAAGKEGEIIVSPHAQEEWKMYRGVLDHIKNSVVTAVANNPQVKAYCNKQKRDVVSIVGQIINKKEEVFRVASDLDKIFTDTRNTAGDVAYYWIMNFTAKKMVFQSETECLVKAEPAFPLAYAAVLLFGKHELFLDVLMARFAKKCPYVIPMFFKLEQNESANDHLKKLGYRRKEKGWENEETYNLRQAAMFTFYCAILQTTPVGNNRHPLSNGWTWLARIVNVPPRNITARLLAVFLQVCGNTFIRTYRGQAVKLMKLIHDDLLPIAPRGGISGETRLKTTLEQFISSGQIPVPEGRDFDP